MIRLIKKLLSLTPVRYFISSVAAFIVDYAILLVFNRLLGDIIPISMEIAAAVAFIVSSQINFWINRVWVFKSTGKVFPELGGYYSLATVSFVVKTFILLELMVRIFGLPVEISKPIAEAVMFVVNFLVQKLLIFRGKTSRI